MISGLIVRTLTWLGVVLYKVGLARFVIGLNRSVPRVALYHSCDPQEHDFIAGLGGNTAPEIFARHLDFYMKHYNVVAVDEIESGGEAQTERALAITFDDGYGSVYSHAWPALRERDLLATVYLVTDVLDNEDLVWVNELNWLLAHHPATTRDVLARDFELPEGADRLGLLDFLRSAFDTDAMRRSLASLRDEIGYSSRDLAKQNSLYLERGQIREMAAGTLSFGNHTRTHPSLPRLDREERKAEIEGASRALGADASCRSFAYPFGDLDDSCRQDLRSLGYERLLEVGGFNRPFDENRVARVPISGRSEAEVFAELEIVPPVKAWLKARVGI